MASERLLQGSPRLEKNALDGGWTLGTKSFIRQSGFDQVEAGARVYREQLLDASTGKTRREITADRPCPLCGSGPASWRWCWTKEGFDFHVCAACGMVFVNPVLRPEWTFEMYASSDVMRAYFEMMRHPVRDRFECAKYRYALQRVGDLKGWETGRILDVGCGIGRFLDIAIEQGWEAEGVEIEQRCVADARARGRVVHDRPFRARDFAGRPFRVLSVWDVLEHVLDPHGLMHELADALAPDAVLVVSVPNVDSLAVRVQQQANTQFCGDSHVNYFGVQTLTRMLREHGLQPLSLETYISEVYIVNQHLRALEPGAEEQMLPFVTPEWIHQQLMGNKLLAIAGRSRT